MLSHDCSWFRARFVCLLAALVVRASPDAASVACYSRFRCCADGHTCGTRASVCGARSVCGRRLESDWAFANNSSAGAWRGALCAASLLSYRFRSGGWCAARFLIFVSGLGWAIWARQVASLTAVFVLFALSAGRPLRAQRRGCVRLLAVVCLSGFIAIYSTLAWRHARRVSPERFVLFVSHCAG